MSAETADLEIASVKETFGFQAEVQKLLQLMIHSIYSNREIFLRELISNASDANDRLRLRAIGEPEFLEEDPVLKIWVEIDPEAGTLTIRDNGIGMTREEAIANLGTIARSGSADFLHHLAGTRQPDRQRSGQFGVRFYCVFVVAERVEVLTCKAGSTCGTRWKSSADGKFTVEPVPEARRGTAVVLHLKPEAREFADPYRLRALIRRYADHIAFPVLMRKPSGVEPAQDFETVNKGEALWSRSPSEVTAEEYRQFYKHLCHDYTEPLAFSHTKVAGKRAYTSLIYIPRHAPSDFLQREATQGLKLYVNHVFVMEGAEHFLPSYLRFIKGIVDADDLPLNISRELLQNGPDIAALRNDLTQRVLHMLAGLAAEEPDKYRIFWTEFGARLKEGVAEDYRNRAKLLPLLRFTTTRTGNGFTASLHEYLARMQPKQENIYYVLADTLESARLIPYIERLKARGIEVLLLSERIDEWMSAQLDTFEGISFQRATHVLPTP